MPALHILAAAAIALPVYFVVVTIYRLTLHPLAKYPGPLSRKISGWPDHSDASNGTRQAVYRKLHHTYGHVVRVGPNRLSFDTSKAFHDIMTSRNANVAKSGFVGWTLEINDEWHLQQIPDKREHAQRRRVMGHAFTDAALKSAEEFMLGAIENWTKVLNRGADTSIDGWSETKNLAHWTNLMTLDVFGELCFGQNFHATDNGDHPFIHFATGAAVTTQSFAYMPINFLWKPILRSQPLLKFMSPKTYTARWALRKSLGKLIAERQKMEVQAEQEKGLVRKDFFHYVTKAHDDNGNNLSIKTYVAEALLLTIAGTDTTSTALCSALYYLNRNPTKFEKLRAEIDNAFATVDEIHTGPALVGCTYLRGCIEEALRLSPPVPGGLTRKTLRGGTEVDGIHVPAGIDLEVPIAALSHSETYFPDAHAFQPERWILGSKLARYAGGEVTEEALSRQRAAFVPFSAGARNCLGMRMAYMEMSLVLARLVFLFDTRFDESVRPATSQFETWDYFVATKSGPFMQFKLRPGVTF